MVFQPIGHHNQPVSQNEDMSTLSRKDVEFRFYSHVHEYLCPANPNREDLGSRSVFAGGGITNCVDWQVEFAQLVNEQLKVLSHGRDAISNERLLSILNPRRSNFPIGDPTASEFQIAWEHKFLQQAKAISLWFPNGSEGPISLFETGKWMMSAKPFFLGIEPGYLRKQELLAHVQAVRPSLQAVESLEEHALNVARWTMGIGKVDLPVLPGRVIERSIYLAGGIKNCPDWQGELLGLLSGSNLIVENPRKEGFVRGSDQAYREMVHANRKKLDGCEAVIMWFPKDHLTPIALLELGTLVALPKPLFIGVEPGYKRQIDVEVQTRLAKPEIDIAYSLQELSEQVRSYYSMR